VLVTGALMLAIFAIAAGLMFARILPALLAVPLMALAIAAVAGTGVAGVASTLVDGTVRLETVIATVIFGALLSRVTISTGIAETIVSYAAEFGGDRSPCCLRRSPDSVRSSWSARSCCRSC
jgi:L-lactate permease